MLFSLNSAEVFSFLRLSEIKYESEDLSDQTWILKTEKTETAALNLRLNYRIICLFSNVWTLSAVNEWPTLL